MVFSGVCCEGFRWSTYGRLGDPFTPVFILQAVNMPHGTLSFICVSVKISMKGLIPDLSELEKKTLTAEPPEQHTTPRRI